jgi:GntR family transcriptional regulator, transcriptional repressor for pyruvate dehydrogenase complex
MREVVRSLETTDDAEQVAHLHREFQSIVVEATGNASLSSILRALQLRGEHVRRTWLSSDPTIRDVALAHQKLLLDAFERGDADMARSIATVQVDQRQRWVDQLLHQQTPEPTKPTAELLGTDSGTT